MINKNAAIIIKNKKILLTRKINTNTFISPGGKNEKGETDLECLKRELREEISVDIVSARHFSTDESVATFENLPIRIISWLVDIRDNPQAGSEIAELKWVSDEEVSTLNIGSIFKYNVIPKLKVAGLL